MEGYIGYEFMLKSNRARIHLQETRSIQSMKHVWGGHEHERRLAMEGEPAGLLHAKVLRLGPFRQRPVEAAQQVG